MSEMVALEAHYGVDWDAQTGRLVHPLAAARAQQRDSQGQPFVVELRGRDGRVQTVIRSCAAEGVLHVLVVGDLGGVDREYQYVELWKNALHLRHYRDYRQQGVAAAERGASACFEADITRAGKARLALHGSNGGAFQTQRDVPEPHRTLAKAAFGNWAAYLEQPASITAPDGAPAPDPTTEAHEGAGHRPSWAGHPGLRPRHLDALFTAGARLEDEDYGTAEIQAPEDAGIVRLPTGHIIAADPWTLKGRDEPFTVTVAAGDYRVLIGRMTWTNEGWGEITGAKLEIQPDRPTATWEPALRPGQDPRLLGTGEFYGFGVDTATGCFLDAAVREVFTHDEEPRKALGFEGACYASWTDPATGGSVIAYPSGMGDGSYPVWIGRDISGEVTCLIADMLILNSAEPVAPTAEDATPYCLPKTELTSEAPACGPFSAATDHLAQIRADVATTAAEVRSRWGQRT